MQIIVSGLFPVKTFDYKAENQFPKAGEERDLNLITSVININ